MDILQVLTAAPAKAKPDISARDGAKLSSADDGDQRRFVSRFDAHLEKNRTAQRSKAEGVDREGEDVNAKANAEAQTLQAAQDGSAPNGMQNTQSGTPSSDAETLGEDLLFPLPLGEAAEDGLEDDPSGDMNAVALLPSAVLDAALRESMVDMTAGAPTVSVVAGAEASDPSSDLSDLALFPENVPPAEDLTQVEAGLVDGLAAEGGVQDAALPRSGDVEAQLGAASAALGAQTDAADDNAQPLPLRDVMDMLRSNSMAKPVAPSRSPAVNATSNAADPQAILSEAAAQKLEGDFAALLHKAEAAAPLDMRESQNLASRATTQTATTMPPLVKNVLSRFEDIELSEGKTRVLLRPHGLGTIEIDLITMSDGRIQLKMRVENPMVLEALRQDEDSLSRFMSERGFDLSGGGAEFSGFDHGAQDQAEDSAASPQDAANVAAGNAVSETSVSAEHIAADGLNILT